MAIKFLDHLDLNNISQLQNTLLHNTTEAGTTDVESKIIYDTGTNTIKYYDGTTWVELDGTGTTYGIATSTVAGVVKIEDDTTQTTAANTVSTTAGRTYGVQLNASDQLVVNVPWTDNNTTYSAATSTVLGLAKLEDDTTQTVAANTVSATAGRTYGVQFNSSDQLVVNVPWTDNNTTYTAGVGLTLSGTQFKADLIDETLRSVTAETITTTANRTYAVMPDADGDLVVNVPWVDNNTTYSTATSSVLGLVKLGSDTTQTVAAQTVSATASRTYAVQLNASDQMVVNVPWINTDTNTDTLQSISADSTNNDRFITTVANASGAQAGFSHANLKYNPSTDTLLVNNLVVSGTSTSVNVETITVQDNIIVLNSNAAATPTEDAGIEVERGSETNVQFTWDEGDDDWQFQAYDHAGTPVLQTYKIPTSYQTTIGNGAATSIAVTHNLGTKNVIVQLWDTSTFDTVFASVVRNTTNQVTIDFSSAPATGDVTVLVITAQGQQ